MHSAQTKEACVLTQMVTSAKLQVDTKHILTDSADQEIICQKFTLVLPE